MSAFMAKPRKPGQVAPVREGATFDSSDANAVVRQDAAQVKRQEDAGDKVAQAEEEDLVDKYLREVHWTRQTVLSTQQAIKSTWKRLVAVRGVDYTKDSLKSFWTTIGVVSALLLSVTYSTVVTPLITDDPIKKTAASFVTVVGGLSLIISLALIVITVIYLIEIDNCTTTRDLEDFIRNNGSIFDVITGFFSASVGLLGAMALATMYVTFPRTEFIIVVSFTGVMAVLMAIFGAVVAGHNRFRMWARYDSPLALQRGVLEKLGRERLLREKRRERQAQEELSRLVE